MLAIKTLNQFYGGSHTLWDVTLDIAPGSRMLPSGPKAITLQLAETRRSVTFEGKPVDVSF